MIALPCATEPWGGAAVAAACGLLGQPNEEAPGLVQMGARQGVIQPGEEKDTA